MTILGSWLAIDGFVAHLPPSKSPHPFSDLIDLFSDDDEPRVVYRDNLELKEPTPEERVVQTPMSPPCSEILYELVSEERLPRLRECRDELQRFSHRLFRINTSYEVGLGSGFVGVEGYRLVPDFDCEPGSLYNDTNLFSSTNLSWAQGCARALSVLGENYTAIRVSSNLIFEDYYKVVLSPK